MLKDDSINTVFVTTQHSSHAKFVCEALQAGKHVFVEKPLAIHREQLDQVEGVVRENGASSPVLMVGFNRRFSPHAQLLKRYFATRTTPLFLQYRVNAGFITPDIWIQDPEVGGGRIIGEGCHFVDFVSYLTGSRVVEVQAQSVDVENAKLVAEDSVSINLKYADGSVANLTYVAFGSSDFAKERCEIFADESMAVMEDFCKTTCCGKLGKEKLKGKQAKGFAEELEAFASAVKSGDSSPISFESLVNTTETCFAINEAMQCKSTVRL
jgi:polar amino acid transport system substrate-binding protein